MRKPITNNSEISFGFHLDNAFNIDEHVDKPEEQKGRKNQHGEFMLQPCTFRIIRTDSDGLKGTQERGGADAKTSDNSGYIHDCLTTDIIQKMCTPKDDMMFGINAHMMDKILTMVRCMKMESTGFFK
jgi:hypothetical protein